MLPKLPETVKVGPHVYRIQTFSKKDMVSDDGEDLLGECLQDTLLIKLKKGMRRSKFQEVLLHELQHAAHYLAGRSEEDTLTGEQWVETVSQNFLHILRENPALVAYLTS